MAKSLLEQLPEIVANGRRIAEKILESIEGKHRITLQTREIVMPNKDVAQATFFACTTQHNTTQHNTIILKTGTTASSTATIYSLWQHCSLATKPLRVYAVKLI